MHLPLLELFFCDSSKKEFSFVKYIYSGFHKRICHADVSLRLAMPYCISGRITVLYLVSFLQE